MDAAAGAVLKGAVGPLPLPWFHTKPTRQRVVAPQRVRGPAAGQERFPGAAAEAASELLAHVDAEVRLDEVLHGQEVGDLGPVLTIGHVRDVGGAPDSTVGVTVAVRIQT